MKLQMSTRYALYAVMELSACPDHQVSAAEIAEKYSISSNHLAKVMRTLGRAGLVEAVRGMGGGYRLAVDAKRITLLDVIALFEPIGSKTAGTRDAGDTTAEGQALRRVLWEIEDLERATLESITLSTMLKLVRPVEAIQDPPADAPYRPSRAVVA
ncbi:Rrf2 family transcriptional regulator [Pararhodospirillum oryzae]|uniref:Transcriptional regulator n=1 Tax=Pararhodospirillum oryzae TaxID=478448 RepID=A0A512H7D7_9PROT|nr:Rrf2 family transcriptional regulator [Pararhodospirillum oryzae]GEO81369.1 transcriptional regulator [Pararhodospirillum oryzae]